MQSSRAAGKVAFPAVDQNNTFLKRYPNRKRKSDQHRHGGFDGCVAVATQNA